MTRLATIRAKGPAPTAAAQMAAHVADCKRCRDGGFASLCRAGLRLYRAAGQETAAEMRRVQLAGIALDQKAKP